MFVSIMRSLAAIIAGLIVASVLVVVIELISAIFHPFPPGVDTTDYEVNKVQVQTYPHWVLAAAGVGWAVTTFIGVWIATRFGTNRHPVHGLVVGGLLATAVGFNIWMLPYYLWFKVLNLIAIPIAILFGIKIGSGGNTNGSDSMFKTGRKSG